MKLCHHCYHEADTLIHGLWHCIACAVLHHANDECDL